MTTSRARHLRVVNGERAPHEAQDTASESWDILIAKHNHRVFISLLALGLTHDAAEDLAQQTWLRLLEQQRGGRLNRLELPGLAITQARFLARDEVRRSGRHQRFVKGLRAEPPSLDSDDPEQWVLARAGLAQAQAALDACSPGARRLYLYIYENPTEPHAEVARAFGLSLQRVRSVLCEVRQRLRSALQESL